MPPLVPFIVGAPRSGTTLLRIMLDAHPLIAIAPETGFAGAIATGTGLTRDALFARMTGADAWPDFHMAPADLQAALAQLDPFTPADGLRAFHTLYARRFGKPRWGEKTPDHVMRIRDIGALLPEARFIHIIRDGRDVAASLRRMWFAPSQDYDALGAYWMSRVREGRRHGAGNPAYLEIRYEDLIADPSRVLSDICDFIDAPFDPVMTRYFETSAARIGEHEGRTDASGAVWLTRAQRQAQQSGVTQPPDRSRIGAWRASMTAADERSFRAGADGLLEELGF